MMTRHTAGMVIRAGIATVPAERWQFARWKAVSRQDIMPIMKQHTADMLMIADIATVPAERRPFVR